MSTDGLQQVFRVTVRGRFRDLSDASRRYLVGARDEHDIFKSAYTVEGSLTYDKAIDFFNLRYEVHVGGDSPATAAADTGLAEAERFLRTMKFAHGELKVDVVDMSAMWADVELRKRR